MRLESPDRRVARGGDLVLDGTRFVKISSSYGSPSSPNYGLGGPQVTTMGFEGLIRRGQTRVNDPLDLRYELHEPMHVYNHSFFADPLPSWLDEGYAIQAQVNAVCGADPRLDTGGWSFWKPGDTDGHTVGSEFFKRLGAAYGCGCAAEVWRDLVDAHGSDRYLTNASATSLVVNVALLDANGLELAARSYTLQPLGMTQVTQVVRDMGVTADVLNAVLLLSTARLDAAFAAYATVIDRTTNDPGTLLPR